MKKNTSLCAVLTVMAICLTASYSYSDTLEHSVIKPIPKSILEKASEHKDYIYEFPFYNKEEDAIAYKELRGTFRKLTYRIFGKDKHRRDGIFSSVEIIKSYKELAVKRGGTILWERGQGDRLTFAIPNSVGGKTWCQVFARDGFYELDIVEKETIKKPPVSKSMKSEFDTKGSITSYSILFDLDRYNLKKESMTPLREIGQFLIRYPELHIEIQGHTDNHGSDEYNIQLSKKRAEAVRLFLTGMGINASRLTAKGHGSSRPVASNDSEKGREKNRRVVFKKKTNSRD